MTFKIGFKLMELDELLEKSVNPDPKYMDNRENRLKSLYNLSLGEYWFEFEGQTIPTAHPDWLEIYSRDSIVTGVDYPVLQLFDDFEEFLPWMLSPVPRVLSESILVGRWCHWLRLLDEYCSSSTDYASGGISDEDVKAARLWWKWRKYGFWYLVEAPDIYIWLSDEELVQVEWNTREKKVEGVLTMVEVEGKTALPYLEFLKALNSFRDDLLKQLGDRVDELARRELINDDGKANLLQQAALYRDHFNAALTAREGNEDWPATLAAIRRLEPLIGPLF